MMRKTILPALAYVVLSTLLSILNRYLLHTRAPAFPYPSILIATQAVFLGSLTQVGLRSVWYIECADSIYWPHQLDRWCVARLLCFVLSYAADVFLTQSALSSAPVSLVELIKTMCPVVVLIGVSALEMQCPGLKESIFVCMICGGVVLATQSDGVVYNVDPGGLALSVLATLAGGTRLIITQVLLQGKNSCPMPLLLMYFSPALFLTGGTAFITEEATQLDVLPEAMQGDHLLVTLSYLALSSALAFGLNYSELWCVRATSALLLTLLSAVKVVCLVTLSSLFAGQHLAPLAIVGTLMTIGGAIALKVHGFSNPSRAAVKEDTSQALVLGSQTE